MLDITLLRKDLDHVVARLEARKSPQPYLDVARFTTLETTMLLVVKRSGNVEQFDRNKVISGVRKACQGRPIKEDDLKALGQQVEEDLRARGLAQVKSDEVGKAILKPLRDLDEVAYMRFASVYQNFENLGDFQNAINELKADALQ